MNSETLLHCSTTYSMISLLWALEHGLYDCLSTSVVAKIRNDVMNGVLFQHATISNHAMASCSTYEF